MNTFIFTLTIDGHSECSLNMADAIFAAADDSSVGSRDGVVTVVFDRQAPSLDEAIRTAIRDLGKAGYRASHIEIDDSTLSVLR